MSEIRAPFPWTGDAMAYAKAHVAAGVLRVEADGTIWRCKTRHGGGWRDIEPRRMENVGGKGYLRVSLNVAAGLPLAIVMAHCLIYEVFVGPIPDGLQIDHKDNDKTNNRPDNLEPVTGLENMRRSFRRGRTQAWAIARKDGGREWRSGRPMLTEEQRQRAREMRASGEPLKRIAKALGIGLTHAQRITSGGSR